MMCADEERSPSSPEAAEAVLQPLHAEANAAAVLSPLGVANMCADVELSPSSPEAVPQPLQASSPETESVVEALTVPLHATTDGDVSASTTPPRGQSTSVLEEDVFNTGDHPTHGGASSDFCELERHPVQLNVYDVGDSEVLQLVNDLGAGDGDFLCLGGVFRAGIEVHGEEWSFEPSASASNDANGLPRDSRSFGIGSSRPRAHPRHTYRTTVPLDSTSLNKQQVQKLLANMDEDWRGDTYDAVHRNSISFCREFTAALGSAKIPGWVDRAPRAAASLKRGAQHSAEFAHGFAQEVAGQLLIDRDEPEQACRETLKAVHEGVVEAVQAVRVEIAEAVPTFQAVREEVSGEFAEAGKELAEVVQDSTRGLRSSVRRWAKEAQVAASWAFMEDSGGHTTQRSSPVEQLQDAAEGGADAAAARNKTSRASGTTKKAAARSSSSFWLDIGDAIFGFDPHELTAGGAAAPAPTAGAVAPSAAMRPEAHKPGAAAPSASCARAHRRSSLTGCTSCGSHRSP
jgi:hypothetical protein